MSQNNLASFIHDASYEDLSDEVVAQLKAHLLDALGCGVGALDAVPLVKLRGYVQEMGGNPTATTIGGIKTSPSWAAFYNTALIRFLDHHDTHPAQVEVCHPSDNIGAVLAAAEYADGLGKDFLTALAVAYQVHCRLSSIVSVPAESLDHAMPDVYGVTAGAAKALGLTEDKIAQSLAISGTSNSALRVTRTECLSEKGLACANAAFNGVHAVFLARAGITGPIDAFEGNKGPMELTAGPFSIDWRHENTDVVLRTALKKHHAETHSQSALEELDWDDVAEKFHRLANRHAGPALQNAIVEAVLHLDRLPVRRLTHLLSMAKSQIDLRTWARDAS